MRKLVAVDMFCGAGGFTEGFKQSGFEVAACLDNWSPAVETHRRNHPETTVFQADILEFDSSNLPKADVLIGSPPCTEFSYANRGGHGDLGLGMQFVLRFLRFVHETKPRYWIMENVPRLLQSLPPRVSLRRLGLQEDGFLEIPTRRILNSADYGAPQKRLRLISGRFPLPTQTHTWSEGLDGFLGLKRWVSARDVVGLLPDPLGPQEPTRVAHDPTFDLEIPQSMLTDHFMDTRLTSEEIRINQKSKTDHSWYGRMAFPDPLDRPARTVMATQTGISRETLVMEWSYRGRKCYRRPTIRECASFQTFPITYQFWGSTAQVRYKLVGNAVPAALASALARGIIENEGGSPPIVPILSRNVSESPPAVTVVRGRPSKVRRRYPPDRKFRDHIAGSKAMGVRVDFANVFDAPTSPLHRGLSVRWEARLIAGSGKSVVQVTPTLSDAARPLIQWARVNGEVPRVGRFFTRLSKAFGGKVPDASTLQAAWTGLAAKSVPPPDVLLRRAARVVDASFPPERFDPVSTPLSQKFPPLGRASVPVRRLAQLVALKYIVDSTSGAPEGRSEASLAEQLDSMLMGQSASRRLIIDEA